MPAATTTDSIMYALDYSTDTAGMVVRLALPDIGALHQLRQAGLNRTSLSWQNPYVIEGSSRW
jgi:hypothetical protein